MLRFPLSFVSRRRDRPAGTPIDGHDAGPGPGVSELPRTPLSIRRKLGLVFLSVGAVVLLIIGLTYRTFAELASDNAREELSRAQEASVFRAQLLTMRFLRGEDLAQDVSEERGAYESRRKLLLAQDEVLGQSLDEGLSEAWERYRAASASVIAAQGDLEVSADAALVQFAPWLSALATLEAAMDPSDADYEDHLGLLADCRRATSTLNSSFFKLVSAPPGDPERQARLSLSVAVEAIGDLIEELHDAGTLERPPAATLEGLPEAESTWESLRERLDEVAQDKSELRDLVGPSGQLNLADSFTELMESQHEASLRYDELSAYRQRLMIRILATSALIVVALVAVAMMVVRRSVVDPIRSLTEGTARLASGDLDARIETEANDEIGLLARSFNGMAESLAQSRRQLQDWADTLEEQVRQRTEELHLANERLIQESKERERIEGELRLAQKLEAVGQLAAGIAHEINTPIQFVGDNTRFLEEVVADTTPILAQAAELAKGVRDGSTTPADGEALLALMEKADVDYITAESATAIKQMLGGLERVSKIVRAMKEFSHPGVEDRAFVDLGQAIESTVTVATSEWKYVAEVQLDFDPELPPVPCQAGEINQVVLNMIVNAAHAIADVVADREGERGTIRIATERDGNHAVIRISDTGAGIPEEIRDKVFDQFFTTKDVGRGTGQGLSIAHAVIVGKHGGTIQLESEVGKGTTFTLRIPISKDAGSEVLEAA